MLRGSRFIGANAALAEDHIVVAAGQDVFARQQQFLNGAGDAALEEHRLAGLAKLAQQIEILHVTGANLEAIDERQHRLDLRNLHHFADHKQSVRIRRFAHELQSRNAHALEGVWRTAGLEGSSAQKAAAGSFDALGGFENLGAVLDGTRPGHDDHLLAAQLDAVPKLHHGAFRAKTTASQLIGRADAMDIKHACEQFKLPQIQAGGGPNPGQNALGCPCGSMNVDSCFHHGIDHCVDLLFGGILLHRYDHCAFPVSGVFAPVPWPDESPPRPEPVAGDPDVIAWAFLSDANSLLCRARITSMMRS